MLEAFIRYVLQHWFDALVKLSCFLSMLLPSLYLLAETVIESVCLRQGRSSRILIGQADFPPPMGEVWFLGLGG